MTEKDLISSLPPLLSERVDPVGTTHGPLGGDFVLYWMRHAVRGHENPALDTALLAGRALEIPVFVCQVVPESDPYASDRHHTFMLEGARDVAAELAERGIGYALHVERPGNRGDHLVTLGNRSAVVITEDMPVEPVLAQTFDLAAGLGIPLWQVDSSAVCPMLVVGRTFKSVTEFKDAHGKGYSSRVPGTWPEVEVEGDAFIPEDLPFSPVRPDTMDIPSLVALCEIDHGVGAVPEYPGGSVAGYARWQTFCTSALESYGKRRDNPVSAGVSGISPYLHYGQVSPFRLAREAGGVGGEGSAKFLSFLLVWRDLSHSFCKFESKHGAAGAIPKWARDTLKEHQTDPRPALPDWETLARAQSGDDLWDLAQRSLVAHGTLHDNVRQTWAKALLKWTPDLESAIELALDLNNRYALDGRGPNSYQGVLWAFGLLDHPHQPEREILGTVRSKDTAWQSTMIDMPGYRRLVSRAPVVSPPRVVVVGAGLAGLSCARALGDHGLRPVVLERVAAPGGRLLTRQEQDCGFDLGTQHFMVRDPRFEVYVDAWRDQGLIAPWAGRFGQLGPDGLQDDDAARERLVAVPGMNALCEHLAEDLEIRVEVEVTSLDLTRPGWIVRSGDEEVAQADLVILALPAPQAAVLLAGTESHLTGSARSVEVSPGWAMMLGFEEPLGVEYDGIRVGRGSLGWISRDSSKPERHSPFETWVSHASASWSEIHLDDDPDDVVAALAPRFFEVLGVEPRKPLLHFAHPWPFSRAIGALQDGAWMDSILGVGVCGDWLHGDDVEGAFLSGRAMAGRVMGELGIRGAATRG